MKESDFDPRTLAAMKNPQTPEVLQKLTDIRDSIKAVQEELDNGRDDLLIGDDLLAGAHAIDRAVWRAGGPWPDWA